MKEKYANKIGYSDVYPFEIVKVISPKTLVVRAMSCEVVKVPSAVEGGFVAHFENNEQEWKITPNPDAKEVRIRQHKDGCWYDRYKNKFNLSEKPVKFYDYNF